jgi:kumamolisin
MPGVPAGYVPLSNSERRRRRGSELIGPANSDEVISISVRVRRRTGGGRLPEPIAFARHVASRQEVSERFGADERDLASVAAFAKANGLEVVEQSIPRRTVVLCGTVGQAARAFRVNLATYETDGERYRGRDGNVHVPVQLAEIIEGVFGLDNRRMARRAQSPPYSTTALSPLEVAKLYDFPVGIDATGQTIGLIEFGNGFEIDDITEFYARFGLSAPKLTTVEVDGITNSPKAGEDTEVTLDIDVSGTVAPGADIAVYFAPGTEQGWVDIITTAVHDTTNRPSVLSISWGWPENETFEGLTWSKAAIEAVDETFKEAALLGITVLAASGDHGSGCRIGDHKAHVMYPGSDPFVISCGGTMISNINGTQFTETTWVEPEEWVSGGGVSDIFELPPWQTGVGVPVSANGDGRVGRGIPDVAGNAAKASGYQLVEGGEIVGPVGGTSAVAPLYAGLVVLLNAALRRPVGYLNPLLYGLADRHIFRDVADGASNATGGAPGYTAGPGWDACTGFGSIDGDALLKALREPLPWLSLLLGA